MMYLCKVLNNTKILNFNFGNISESRKIENILIVLNISDI